VGGSLSLPDARPPGKGHAPLRQPAIVQRALHPAGACHGAKRMECASLLAPSGCKGVFDSASKLAHSIRFARCGDGGVAADDERIGAVSRGRRRARSDAPYLPGYLITPPGSTRPDPPLRRNS